jgi:hypothetical protein
MISEDIKIVDLDDNHLLNLAKALKTELEESKGGSEPIKPDLVIIHEQGRVEMAFHTERGNLCNELREVSARDLESLARKFGASNVFCLEKGALKKMARSLQAGAGPDRDLSEDDFVVYRSSRDGFESGVYDRSPFARAGNVNFGSIANIAKLVAPSDESMVFVMFDAGSRDLAGLPIFTSLILHFNKARQLELVTTTKGLAKQGLDSIYDWKVDYKKILKAAQNAFGSAAMGIFAEMGSLRELKTLPQSQRFRAFMDLIKQGKIIIDPFPLKLRLLLKAGGIFR